MSIEQTKEKKEFIWYANLVFGILLLITSGALVYSVEKYQDLKISFDMYYFDKYKTMLGLQKDGYFVLGLAFGDFITVYTRGRNIVDVLDTCTHEYAHNNLDMGHNKDVLELQNKLKEINSSINK